MAPRGNKRMATQPPVEEPGAKRVTDFLKQQGITQASYQPVLDIVEHPLTGFSEDARRMILAILPWSIAVPAGERHESQSAAVSMVDEVAEAVQEELQKVVDVEAGKVAEIEVTKAELDAAAQRAEAVELEARQVEDSCRGQLEDSQAVMPQRRTALQAAELERKRLDAELEQTQAQKTELDSVLSGSFARLKEGSFEENEAESLVKGVTAVGGKFCLEESLVLALPSALAKRERGAFDVAVIDQAEQALRSSLSALGDVVLAAAAPLAKQVTDVQAAQADFDASTLAEAQSADEFRQAQEARLGAGNSSKAAKDAVIDVEAKLAVARAAKDHKSAALEQFMAYNVFMYKLLRDRVTSKQSEEPVEQQQATESVGVDVATDLPSKVAEMVQGGDKVASLAGA